MPAMPTEPESTTGQLTLDQRGVATLAADLQRRAMANPHRRCIAAIAGLPGSGKSTLARALCIHLNKADPNSAAVLPLDGFHLDAATLQRAGLVERKGSPETFDAKGFFKLLMSSADPTFYADIPAYDRALHEPVYTGKPEHRLTRDTRIVLAEGNYLLLDMLPWTAIDDTADVRWLLDTPAAQAKAWLIRRHIATGRSIEEANHRYDTNDLVNTRLIQDRGRHGDRVLRWPESMLDAGHPA